MKIIVTGGRHAHPVYIRKLVIDWLDNLRAHLVEPQLLSIAQGGATGVDKFVRDWCISNAVNFSNYPYLGEFGKAGGRLRNEVMLKDFQPHLVVAFPGGKGTRHMTLIAKRDRFLVIEVKQEKEHAS